MANLIGESYFQEGKDQQKLFAILDELRGFYFDVKEKPRRFTELAEEYLLEMVKTIKLIQEAED